MCSQHSSRQIDRFAIPSRIDAANGNPGSDLSLGVCGDFETQLDDSARNHSRSRQAQVVVGPPSGSDFVTLHQCHAGGVDVCEPSTSQTVQKPEGLPVVVQAGA